MVLLKSTEYVKKIKWNTGEITGFKELKVQKMMKHRFKEFCKHQVKKRKKKFSCIIIKHIYTHMRISLREKRVFLQNQ